MQVKKTINVLTVLLLWATSIFVSANEESSLWGVDLSLGTAHQEYTSSSADMSSFSVSPYILLEGWEISVHLPWYTIDGNYFTNGTLPRVLDICNRLLGLSDIRQQWLIRRGRITQNQLDNCQAAVDELAAAEASASGLGDLGFYANYVVNLTESGDWWGGVGLGYSLDNGDYEKGLGKGARDASVQLSLGSSIGKWQTQLLLGYVTVDATDTTEDIDDYAQVSAGIAYGFTDSFTLGVDYSIEESYIVGEDNINVVTLYSDFTFAEQWNLHLYVSDYAEAEQYPESEIGASLMFSFQ